jgi:hypothetical protein
VILRKGDKVETCGSSVDVRRGPRRREVGVFAQFCVISITSAL